MCYNADDTDAFGCQKGGKVRIVGLFVLALVLGGAAPGVAEASHSKLVFDRTFVDYHFLDRYVPGRTVGDQTLFAAELRQTTGQSAGFDRGFCVTVDGGDVPGSGPFHAECRQSLTLAAGQLDLQGHIDESAYANGVTQTLGVTAGTGAYRTAHGYATVRRTGAATSRLTVHLDLDANLRPRTLVLTQRVRRSHLFDRNLPGRGAGDERYVSTDVSGGRSGSAYASCLTVTDGEGAVPNAPPYQEQCQQSFVLSDGVLTLEGFFDETAFEAGQPQVLPVVGGTGSYDHAHGQATVTRTGPGTSTVVVDLDPPCRPLTRSYLEQGAQFYQVPDERDPSARGTGDLLTSTAAMTDVNDPARTGTSHAYFLTVSDAAGQAPYWAQASQTNRLVPDGAAAGSTARDVIEMGGIFNQTDFEAFIPQIFALNGGAGAYGGAHGQVVATQVIFPATFRLDIELVCDP